MSNTDIFVQSDCITFISFIYYTGKFNSNSVVTVNGPGSLVYSRFLFCSNI